MPPSEEYAHAQFSHMVAESIHEPLQSVTRPQAAATCSLHIPYLPTDPPKS